MSALAGLPFYERGFDDESETDPKAEARLIELAAADEPPAGWRRVETMADVGEGDLAIMRFTNCGSQFQQAVRVLRVNRKTVRVEELSVSKDPSRPSGRVARINGTPHNCLLVPADHSADVEGIRAQIAKLREKADRRWELAGKREADSAAAYSASRLDGIPMGQPILVGHHSERRHRRDLARADSAMRRSVENDAKAKYHERKARSLERRADALEAQLEAAVQQ